MGIEKKRTIVSVISSLQPGGAERVLSILANSLAEKNNSVKILTYEVDGTKPFYPIESEVELIQLNLRARSKSIISALINNVKRILILARELKKQKPDVVISYMVDTSITTLIVMMWSKTPVIVCEHSDPSVFPVSKVWRFLRRVLYLRASLLVVLNETSKKWFEERIPTKVAVIPNPVMSVQNKNDPTEINSEKSIIAVGRLVHVKGYDILLQSFSLINKLYPEWKLKIFGDGSEKMKLIELCKELGLDNQVRFCGVVSDIYKEYQKAGLFIMSSRHEAFPMSLCEAMSSGLCVITTRVHDSISDLVINEQNGLMVEPEDIEGLAEAMKKAMGSIEMRNTLGFKAKERMEEFSVDKVLQQWELQFNSLGL